MARAKTRPRILSDEEFDATVDDDFSVSHAMTVASWWKQDDADTTSVFGFITEHGRPQDRRQALRIIATEFGKLRPGSADRRHLEMLHEWVRTTPAV